MTRFTARIIGPENLTAAELHKALEAIGCHLEAQPMSGNRPAFQKAPVLSFRARPSTSPDLAPEVA